MAEPYALWAIERQPGLALPFSHPDIVLADDLEPYERLKLHILNLGHSWLAARWHDGGGGAADQTVRAALADPDTRMALERVMAEEVLPGFAAHGMADEARAISRPRWNASPTRSSTTDCRTSSGAMPPRSTSGSAGSSVGSTPPARRSRCRNCARWRVSKRNAIPYLRSA